MRKALRILGWLALVLVALLAAAIWWGQDEKGLYAMIFGAMAVWGAYFAVNDIIVNPLKAELRLISAKLEAIERRLRSKV